MEGLHGMAATAWVGGIFFAYMVLAAILLWPIFIAVTLIFFAGPVPGGQPL